ncbi:MAG: hypothetical protein CFE43_01900 [Burkholderiales bacterium PBB3]|nr:MAG: hypothetical protein CFE43_01900 [Burkholderiales bacterium PBB3]
MNPPSSPPEHAPNSPQAQTINRIRWLAFTSTLALIALGIAWELVWAPVRPGGSTLVLKVLPLCFTLTGLWMNRMYTYRWLSLLVWLYFTEGVVRAYSDKAPGNYLALAEVALSVVIFVACVLHVRLRQRYAKDAALKQTTTEVTV